jgi:hypothetical protein
VLIGLSVAGARSCTFRRDDQRSAGAQGSTSQLPASRAAQWQIVGVERLASVIQRVLRMYARSGSSFGERAELDAGRSAGPDQTQAAARAARASHEDSFAALTDYMHAVLDLRTSAVMPGVLDQLVEDDPGD